MGAALLVIALPAQGLPPKPPPRTMLSEKQALVLVECMAVSIEAAGTEIDQAARQTQMELALRRNGVPICQPDTKKSPEFNPGVLVLQVTSIKDATGFAANWNLFVNEMLRPRSAAAKNVLVMGEVWRRGGVLTGGIRVSLDEQLGRALDAALNELCNDYLSVIEAIRAAHRAN